MASPSSTLRPGSRARVVGDTPVPCWMASDNLTELLVATDLAPAPPATTSARPGGVVRLVASVAGRSWVREVTAGSPWLVEWSVGQRDWQAVIGSDRLVPEISPT